MDPAEFEEERRRRGEVLVALRAELALIDQRIGAEDDLAVRWARRGCISATRPLKEERRWVSRTGWRGPLRCCGGCRRWVCGSGTTPRTGLFIAGLKDRCGPTRRAGEVG
jgi:hypothetical protein